MVEMTLCNMKRLFYLYFLITLFCSLSALAQQPAVRIPGLETNEAYMTCLREDARLQERIDSLMAESAAVRRAFKDDSENRERYKTEILKLEERLFALRSEKGQLVDRINAIEQEWILRSLDAAPAGEEPQRAAELPTYDDAPRLRNLVENACFRGELSPGDYATLREAQRKERTAAELIERFADNYARLIGMQDEYMTLTDQAAADSLYDSMAHIREENLRLDDSLQTAWSYIFDNKSYAYSYMLDRYGRDEALESETERLTEAQRASESERGRYASDAMAAYFVQKQALVDFERTVAREFALPEALDSLTREANYLASVEFRLPRIEPERRYLLDYQNVDFSTPSKYDARNPIPACKIYDHGTIYRIRLGRFRVKQAPSIFRGAWPLGFDRDDEGRYCYYAGGYATAVEARLACELLLKRGFRRPEIVRWVDGEREDFPMDGSDAGSFRVEIAGENGLSEAVREAIREAAPDKELARVGALYIVGSFSDRSVAEQVVWAVRAADAALEAEVKEISVE